MPGLVIGLIAAVVLYEFFVANKTVSPISPVPAPPQSGAPVQVWPTYQTPPLPGIPPQTTSRNLGEQPVQMIIQPSIAQIPNPSPLPPGTLLPNDVPIPTLGNSGGWMTGNPDVVPGRIMPPPLPPVTDVPSSGAGQMRGTLIAPVVDVEPPPVSQGVLTPPIIATSPQALDSMSAQQAANGGNGDVLIMTLQTGAQIWKTPAGNTYQVWPN